MKGKVLSMLLVSSIIIGQISSTTLSLAMEDTDKTKLEAVNEVKDVVKDEIDDFSKSGEPKALLEKNNNTKASYYDPNSYPLVDNNQGIGMIADYVWGEYFTYSYISLEENYYNQNQMQLKVQAYSHQTSVYNRITSFEFFTENNGYLTYCGRSQFKPTTVLQNLITNLDKSEFSDQKYIYVRIGVSPYTTSSYYADTLLFKVKNPFFTINEKPEINATDKTIKVGDRFNALTGVSASDKEDGDITSKIVVKENTVNIAKSGVYKVVYSVTDSDNNTVTKEIKVTVNNVFSSFTVNSINNKSTNVTGKGVSGATVKAFVGSKQIGNIAKVDSSGNYKIAIPAQSANIEIVVEMSKSGYETSHKTIKVNTVATSHKSVLTKDIYKYDAGKGKYLTHINGKGYSQFTYLNTSGKYAFTPSSWMKAAGLNVTMPTNSNGYTMMIDNNYITMYNQSNELLNKIKSGKVTTKDIAKELENIEKLKTKELTVEQGMNGSSKAAPKKTLTNDIYKYDAGKGKYLTYINGKGYSQYSYLNTSGKYAFTPSSWMKAAGLNVTMPTSSNGYTMKVDNPYITKYNDIVKQIESYL